MRSLSHVFSTEKNAMSKRTRHNGGQGWRAGRLLALGLFLCVGPSWAEAPAGRYVVSEDTVFDTKTTLTWQRSMLASTWEHAGTACANRGEGWRLPSVKELLTLVDIGEVDLAIDPVFPNTPVPAVAGDAPWLWSSTPLAESESNAWVVNFYQGMTNTGFLLDVNRFRCVR